MRKLTLQNSITLAELMIVVVIIGILASISIPSYLRAKERTIDKQAQATLGLIRGAERAYRMQMGYFYPNTSISITDVSLINSNLGLELVNDGVWSYTISGSMASAGFNASMGRTGFGYDRTWWIGNSTVNATCTGNCP